MAVAEYLDELLSKAGALPAARDGSRPSTDAQHR